MKRGTPFGRVRPRTQESSQEDAGLTLVIVVVTDHVMRRWIIHRHHTMTIYRVG